MVDYVYWTAFTSSKITIIAVREGGNASTISIGDRGLGKLLAKLFVNT